MHIHIRPWPSQACGVRLGPCPASRACRPSTARAFASAAPPAACSQIYSKHLAPTGLKISQFSLLGFVTAEGPVSIGRLSDLLATDRTTLTRNLRPLLSGRADRACASRATSGVTSSLATQAGRALFKRALPLWAAAEQEVRAAMGAKLTADLHGALDRSMENRLAPL